MLRFFILYTYLLKTNEISLYISSLQNKSLLSFYLISLFHKTNFRKKMKNTKDLLKEAIADAKAVRETALTQAKLALEEAFAPRLQSMFAAKLQENFDEEMEMEESMLDAIPETTEEKYADHGNRMEEIDLDEILAELDNELNEAKGDDEEEIIDAEEDAEDMEDDAKEDEDEEKEVSELSMDELEDLIRDIVSQETGDGEGYEDAAGVDAMDIKGDAEMTADAEDMELEEDLDALLAELLDEEDGLNERKKQGYDDRKDEREAMKHGKIGSKDLNTTKARRDDAGFERRMNEELALALETVETLRSELNEVNLLNAKLLYVNKIFNARNLNESQKLKVVKAFDKAESAKEAKLVYESLSEAFVAPAKAGKTQLKESLGFASKAAGTAPKKALIVENDAWISRMQKLANIK
jgi:hypothetical protein